MKLTKGIYAPLLWIALFAAVATAPVWVPALSASSTADSAETTTVRVASIQSGTTSR
jgi:hypothetical protein